MNTRNITLSDDSLNFSGEYFTVSNGFASKVNGKLRIRYNDLLAVELIKRRSKKIMYFMLLFGGVLLVLLDFDNIVFPFILTATSMTIGAVGIIYLISRRQFIELTSMHGTYRIAVEHGDSDIRSMVGQLQEKIKT